MQLISGTAATDSYSVLYVGSCGDKQWWTARWLPGRRLSTDEAITATIVAEMLLRHPEIPGPQWTSIDEGARRLGLSTRDLVGFLGVQCEIPEAPSATPSAKSPTRKALWLPRKQS